jgi:predicted Fe-Mo cluster-binding NifX family protein
MFVDMRIGTASGMKIAVPRYAGRISPRYRFTEDILLVDVGNRSIGSREIVPIDGYFPLQVPPLLHKKGVEVVLTGGMNLHFQRLFRALGIKVIWGLIGTPEEALEGYLSGQLTPGMGRCQVGCRKHRHQAGRL